MKSKTIKPIDGPIRSRYFQVSLGIIVRIRKRLEIRKRHRNKHLDLTLPAFEAHPPVPKPPSFHFSFHCFQQLGESASRSKLSPTLRIDRVLAQF